jgi:hypothetical protein
MRPIDLHFASRNCWKCRSIDMLKCYSIPKFHNNWNMTCIKRLFNDE